ncbi:Der GTPase-activating protein YihI [Vibrio harveyi]|uniref:Der GTPase-activating protein YihI n=1 Tax=Vibrio harveyi TaxID=669 RepID=UPI001EFEEB10|nr:Der GTPase-activating protein YihI [Vibrio harveyi]MCG9611125.1 Der GTPase-activating protein YihI [Vibrio harveyi]MCG9668250.1 Der GTPase-activating protein YihI [Vibrio harveyi]
MSRKKKSRKPGASGAPEFVVTRNRTESDVEGRLRKRAKKRKGLKTGSRNSDAEEQKKQAAAQKRDPRLGSKKKIPLIVEPAKKQTKQERRLSAEQELEMLENDAQLNVLLDRIEAGENLGTGLQKYVDEKLDRIEKLMDQLGLLEPEEDDEDFTAPAVKGSRNDDDLLADFDDYKG